MQGVICTLPAFSTVSKMEPAPPRIKKRPRNMSGATSQKLRFRFFDFGACASAQDDTAKRRAVYLVPRSSARIEHSRAFSACFLRTPTCLAAFSFTSANSDLH